MKQELDYARKVVEAAEAQVEYASFENYEWLQLVLHQYRCFKEGRTCRCMEKDEASVTIADRQQRRIAFAREVAQGKEVLKEDEMVDLIADLVLIIDEHLVLEKPSSSPEG